MRPDTYSDYISRVECAQGRALAQIITNARIQRLMARSGAHNVTSGVLTTFDDPHHDALALRVSFDSRAWTGLS